MTAKTLEQEARFIAVADYIDAYPEEFEMEAWCGSARCIAGTAVFLFDFATYKAELDHEDHQANADRWHVCDASCPRHPEVDIESSAISLLGLTQKEASKLFLMWTAPEGLTHSDVLRKLAGGADLDDLTRAHD